MNICGCLVHTMPDQASAVAATLDAKDGVEVYARAPDGRIVVVVEDTADARASDIIMSIHQIQGVVSLTLTYHHFEDPQDKEAGRPAMPANATSVTGAQP